MRRLIRAIEEIKSYRNAITEDTWPGASELMLVGLLNTSIAMLQQVEAMAPVMSHRHPGIIQSPDRVSEMIRQVNAEVDDDVVASEVTPAID